MTAQCSALNGASTLQYAIQRFRVYHGRGDAKTGEARAVNDFKERVFSRHIRAVTCVYTQLVLEQMQEIQNSCVGIELDPVPYPYLRRCSLLSSCWKWESRFHLLCLIGWISPSGWNFLQNSVEKTNFRPIR